MSRNVTFGTHILCSDWPAILGTVTAQIKRRTRTYFGAEEEQTFTATAAFLTAKKLWKMMDVKLVFLGDGGVGRSSFICCARDYTPCDCCSVVNIMVNGKTLSVGLWKTYTEKEDYARLRPLSYQGAHAFLACFDVANRASFQNVIEKWIPEVRQFDPNIPILLLGTKTDLRGAK